MAKPALKSETTISRVSESRCFDGVQGFYSHDSATTGCAMRFAVYVPPQAEHGDVPVLWWLSGLTCTEENFTVKAGAQRHAAEHGLIVVAPDTSPRGTDINGQRVPDKESYDLGQGAGFYLNATRKPWSTHFRMYDYVVDELPEVIFEHFPARRDAQGIFGHSMGGLGALVMALRNPETYQSVSAFAPICAPTQSSWGHRAFSAYLGSDRESWRAYDPTELVRARPSKHHIVVDQGSLDPFLTQQLHVDLLQIACQEAGQALELHVHPGYDHSYYFIASFIGEQIAHHAAVLHGR